MNALELGFLLCLICSLSARSFAQHMNAPDSPCTGPASTLEATNCFTATWEAADKQLDNAYGRVREVLSPDERKDLQEAERLWMKFRDADCAAERNLYKGGSAGPMAYAACVAVQTQQRTEDLKTIYGWRLKKWGKSFD